MRRLASLLILTSLAFTCLAPASNAAFVQVGNASAFHGNAFAFNNGFYNNAFAFNNGFAFRNNAFAFNNGFYNNAFAFNNGFAFRSNAFAFAATPYCGAAFAPAFAPAYAAVSYQPASYAAVYQTPMLTGVATTAAVATPPAYAAQPLAAQPYCPPVAAALPAYAAQPLAYAPTYAAQTFAAVPACSAPAFSAYSSFAVARPLVAFSTPFFSNAVVVRRNAFAFNAFSPFAFAVGGHRAAVVGPHAAVGVRRR